MLAWVKFRGVGAISECFHAMLLQVGDHFLRFVDSGIVIKQQGILDSIVPLPIDSLP